MGMILARMPWNQVEDAGRCSAGSKGGSMMKLSSSAAWRAVHRPRPGPGGSPRTPRIVLFERGPDVSFANCGLPYYVGGEIAERDKLLVATPERLRPASGLDVRTRTSVEAIDRRAKTVRVRDLASGGLRGSLTTS